MNRIMLYDLIKQVSMYDQNNIDMIKKAYLIAEFYHRGQYRESGEEYITHPLNVAYYLSLYRADVNMICAALLHDTLEDTSLTKNQVNDYFNSDVAHLVDGVTKISKLEYSSKDDAEKANIRKLVSSITEDVRIIIIKLADRLHNMQTLEYKRKEKQVENAMETLKIFAPIAYYLGAYKIKMELEDLSLKYIKPDDYKRIYEDRLSLIEASKNMFDDMQYQINDTFNQHGIYAYYKTDVKNVYGIYQDQTSGNELFKIYDLFGLKVLVDDIDKCYRALGLIHATYRPLNEKIRDYIANPKPNLYKSLNTAVFYPDGKIVQARIRTPFLDKVDQEGLIAYYNEIKDKDNITMQECFQKNFKFYDNLNEIDNLFNDNNEFLDKVSSELFGGRLNIYIDDGRVIQLPIGSTPIDIAYKMNKEIGNKMIGAQVNGMIVPLNQPLQEKDRVRILVDENAEGPNEKWLGYVHTTTARRRIKEFLKK